MKKEEGKKDLKLEIYHQLQQTGYPSELQVQSILNKNKWYVEAAGSYRDYDNNILREIDLYASKHIRTRDEIHVDIDLSIEVKSIHPNAHWVFSLSNLYGETPDYLVSQTPTAGKLLLLYEIHEILNPSLNDFYGLTGTVTFTKKESNWTKEEKKAESKKIYSALNQACKAAYDRYKTTSVDISELPPDLESGVALIQLFFPLIVVNTPNLYVAQLDEQHEMYLEEKQLVPYIFPYRSDNYNNQRFIAYIVTQNYLSTYLSDLEQKQEIIKNKMIDYKKVLSNKKESK